MRYFAEEKNGCLCVYFWYRRVLTTDQTVGFHLHEGRYELTYVETGEVLFQSKKQNGEIQSTRVYPGQFIFIASGISHWTWIEAGKTAKISNIEFTSVLPETEIDKEFILGKLFRSSFEVGNVLGNKKDYFIVDDIEGVLDSILSLHLELDEYFYRPKQDNEFMVQLLINRTLVLVSRCVLKMLSQKGTGYINRILSVINKVYSQDVSVPKVAKAVGLHPTYMNRIFKEATGSSIIEYTNNLRLKKAKKLLIVTDYPIIEVAIEAGFNNRQHFHETFKKKIGMTPNAFRRRYKK